MHVLKISKFYLHKTRFGERNGYSKNKFTGDIAQR